MTTNGQCKIPVVYIRIERGEGPSDLCTVSEHTKWSDAEERIKSICQTAPKAGGYDKTDFFIRWKDGEEYAGRYDAKHPDAPGHQEGTLANHVREHLRFMSGEACPSYMKPAHYKEFMRECGVESQQSARLFLRAYQIGEIDRAFPVGSRVLIPYGTEGVCSYLWEARGTVTGHRWATIDDREVNVIELDRLYSSAPGWGIKSIGLPDFQLARAMVDTGSGVKS